MENVSSCVMFLVNCLTNSYADAFFQLIIDLMCVCGLCSFIVACRLGAVGFMLCISILFLLYCVFALTRFINEYY
jgi:hypothetical protein